jgi:uncharacterized protein
MQPFKHLKSSKLPMPHSAVATCLRYSILIADEVEWKFCGSKGLPYTGTFRTKDEIARWFASIPEVEEILAFKPREFISAGDSVTVVGWERIRARPAERCSKRKWVHVFTPRDGRLVRFWGMYDTEASAAVRA